MSWSEETFQANKEKISRKIRYGKGAGTEQDLENNEGEDSLVVLKRYILSRWNYCESRYCISEEYDWNHTSIVWRRWRPWTLWLLGKCYRGAVFSYGREHLLHVIFAERRYYHCLGKFSIMKNRTLVGLSSKYRGSHNVNRILSWSSYIYSKYNILYGIRPPFDKKIRSIQKATKYFSFQIMKSLPSQNSMENIIKVAMVVRGTKIAYGK